MRCGGGGAGRGLLTLAQRGAARRRRGAASSRLVADQRTGRAARIQKAMRAGNSECREHAQASSCSSSRFAVQKDGRARSGLVSFCR